MGRRRPLRAGERASRRRDRGPQRVRAAGVHALLWNGGRRSGAVLGRRIGRAVTGTERLWLVLAHTDPGDEYWKALTPSHQIVLDRLYPHQSGIRVMCLSRRVERPT